MTEEQVKQVVADMIFSGELEIIVGSVYNSFLKRTDISLQIFHQKEDGYRKKLTTKSTRA